MLAALPSEPEAFNHKVVKQCTYKAVAFLMWDPIVPWITLIDVSREDSCMVRETPG